MSDDVLHVAVGVVQNASGEVLLARRAEHRHQGGLWEFPGGKIEPGESPTQALARELHEELGIDIDSPEPLIRIPYRYPEHTVLLDVWQIKAFSGEPHGREGQPLCWVAVSKLSGYPMPAANRPIMNAIRLPQLCMITPEVQSGDDWLAQLKKALRQDVRLIQLRLKNLVADEVDALTREALRLCHPHGCQVILNADPARFSHLPVDGFHLTSAALAHYPVRPAPPEKWLSASIHNYSELTQAARLKVDFGFAGPVQPTTSHPEAEPLGWRGFAELTGAAGFPLYALGGMQRQDIALARQHGGQGVAGIRLFTH